MKIEVLSRFTPAREQKRILEAAKNGGVDLLIARTSCCRRAWRSKTWAFW